MSLEFRILGPLEVVQAGRPLPLGGRKQRAMLAVLLMHANEVVSSDRLIDDVWGERSPRTAASAVQVYVSCLRKLLGDEMLLTRRPGYLIRVAPKEFDLLPFQQPLGGARENEPATAAETHG